MQTERKDAARKRKHVDRPERNCCSMESKFAVGDRVTWVTRIDGVRRRGFGVISKVEGCIYGISVERLRPIDEAGNPIGVDTYCNPPLRRFHRAKGLTRYTEADLRRTGNE